MARTPRDLVPLIEAILTPEVKKSFPKGGLGAMMEGAAGWKEMKVGFLDPMWGGGDEKKKAKWEGDLVVSNRSPIVEAEADAIRNRSMRVP